MSLKNSTDFLTNREQRPVGYSGGTVRNSQAGEVNKGSPFFEEELKSGLQPAV
jgi:hypothetical protein